jgi:hypothetical protein
MKILHLPTLTGGNSYGLSRGERKIGLHSDVLTFSNEYFRYPADIVLFDNVPRNKIEKVIWRPLLSLKTVVKLRKKYDIFHFNFGSSLIDFPFFGLTLLDLPLFRDYGRIIVTYNGCDARQKFPTVRRVPFSSCHRDDCYHGICSKSFGILDALKREKIKKFERYADAMFALNPDLLYFLPKKARFLPYTIASWDSLKAGPEKIPKDQFRIVHAPTNRAAKGSDVIIRALNNLKNRYGNKIDVCIVENIPNAETLKIFQKADLVIDQILIGWYGAVAVECMKLGTPVMAYIREEDLRWIPAKMAEDCRNAIIMTSPSSIFEDLCQIVENPRILLEKRETGIEYVHKWHDPVYVAGITRDVYENPFTPPASVL